MKLYVDLEPLQLIEAPGFRNPVTSLRFKRGDAARLEVFFLQNGTTPVAIGNPETLEIRFGVKLRGRFDLGYLVQSAVWTMPDPQSTSPVYLCSPSFNTEELDSALNVGSSTSTELSEITLMGEITWREGTGEPTSTRTFLVVVENDVNRGTEGVPTSAEPEYPAPQALALLSSVVRHDVYQSLSPAQQIRARSNIGIEHVLPAKIASGAGDVPDGDIWLEDSAVVKSRNDNYTYFYAVSPQDVFLFKYHGTTQYMNIDLARLPVIQAVDVSGGYLSGDINFPSPCYVTAMNMSYCEYRPESFANCPELNVLICDNTSWSSFPSIAGCPKLYTVSFKDSTVPTYVDDLLIELEATIPPTNTYGIVDVSGANNSPPTEASLAARIALSGHPRHWTIIASISEP